MKRLNCKKSRERALQLSPSPSHTQTLTRAATECGETDSTPNCFFMLAKLVRIHNSANRVLERRRVPKAGWGWAQRGGNHRLERKGERERQVDLFKEWGVGESNFNGFWECTPFSLSLQSCPFPGFPCVLSPSFLYFPVFLSRCRALPFFSLRYTLSDGHSQTRAFPVLFIFLTDKFSTHLCAAHKSRCSSCSAG